MICEDGPLIVQVVFCCLYFTEIILHSNHYLLTMITNGKLVIPRKSNDYIIVSIRLFVCYIEVLSSFVLRHFWLSVQMPSQHEHSYIMQKNDLYVINSVNFIQSSVLKLLREAAVHCEVVKLNFQKPISWLQPVIQLMPCSDCLEDVVGGWSMCVVTTE